MMRDQYLKRDPTAPGAVLNTDKVGLEAYKHRRAARQKDEQRINNLEDAMHEMLAQILAKLS